MKDINGNDLENYVTYDITYKYVGHEVTHRAMFRIEHEFRCRTTDNWLLRPEGFTIPQYWDKHYTRSSGTWYAPMSMNTLPYVPLTKVTKIVPVDTINATYHSNQLPKDRMGYSISDPKPTKYPLALDN